MNTDNGWIKVEDRLPENRTYVLGFVKEGDYNVFEFKHGLFFRGLVKNNNIKFWQPLPEPPKNSIT